MQQLINHVILQLQNPKSGMGFLIAESLIYLHDSLNNQNNRFLNPTEKALKMVLNLTINSSGMPGYRICEQTGEIVVEEHVTEDTKAEVIDHRMPYHVSVGYMAPPIDPQAHLD